MEPLVVSSRQISEEDHQLLLITGARLVQWADDLAHHAGDRFQPGRIRWNRTLADDPAETVRALAALLAETAQELGYLRQTLEGVRERAEPAAELVGRSG
ncbi:MAG: hypothetical protein ACRDZO_20030 [Egibacteraceae bacterium]